MRKRQVLAQALRYSGALTALDHGWWGPQRLTVLAYHRITDVNAPHFYGFAPNVSATPADFDAQMAYVSAHFNVISLDQLRQFIVRGLALPPRPLLITFDDGYQDNYDNAYPILKRYGLPAVIFTVTGRMDDPTPLWWDRCAQAFRQTTLTQAELPYLGIRPIDDTTQHAFMEALKQQPTQAIASALDELNEVLQVSPDMPSLFFGWNQVRTLVDDGVACQPHTVTHPIMTRIPLAQRINELRQSREALLTHTDQPVDTFAYPNGTPADYDKQTILALHELGYEMAVTLSPGPARLAMVKRYPMQIRRVFLSYRDTLDIFISKVLGVPALTSHDSYLEI